MNTGNQNQHGYFLKYLILHGYFSLISNNLYIFQKIQGHYTKTQETQLPANHTFKQSAWCISFLEVSFCFIEQIWSIRNFIFCSNSNSRISELWKFSKLRISLCIHLSNLLRTFSWEEEFLLKLKLFLDFVLIPGHTPG